VVDEAAQAMRASGLGLKAATVTPEGKDDVGSPNRILREGVDGKVIIRTGRRIPGVTPLAGVHHPISSCGWRRGRYGAKGREGRGAPDEWLPHGEGDALDVPRPSPSTVPDGREDGREGLRRPEVDGLAVYEGMPRWSSTTPPGAQPPGVEYHRPDRRGRTPA
jgi:hypothetical protein